MQKQNAKEKNRIQHDKFQHKWTTRYIELSGRPNVSMASGMVCSCGATLTQDEVEEAVNYWQSEAPYKSF